MKFNLLTDPLIRVCDADDAIRSLSLCESLAELSTDSLSGFPALRPHQDQAWHCFLVQLAAQALYLAEEDTPPESPEAWQALLRALTPDFPDDAPWYLVGDAPEKPAFLQPPEPDGMRYTGQADTPTALDLLLTSKNHEIKTLSDLEAGIDDWIFALVTRQTLDGFNGSGNYGISRMNGGSSSRFFMGLIPCQSDDHPVREGWTPGARFRNDLLCLLQNRDRLLDLPFFAETGGHGLLWLLPWPAGDKDGLSLDDLDPFYIEICRRIRLRCLEREQEPERGAGLFAETGTSAAERIRAKALKGAVGDPWAPIDKGENKAITLGEQHLTYSFLCKILFSGNYELPLSLTPARMDRQDPGADWLLWIQAIGRGNSKTFGLQRRLVPVPDAVVPILKAPVSFGGGLASSNELANDLLQQIAAVEKIFHHALAIVAAGGDDTERGHFDRTRPWKETLDQHADREFFPTLWAMFLAHAADQPEEAGRILNRFLHSLGFRALSLFNHAAPVLQTSSVRRFRARARGESRLYGGLRKQIPHFLERPDKKEMANAAE